jgi:hypothetical protein
LRDTLHVLNLVSMPLEKSRSESIVNRDLAWFNMGPQARADIRAGRVPSYPDRPWIGKHYVEWCDACNEIGPLQGSKQQQRKNLCAKRKTLRARLPLHLRQALPEDIIASGRNQAEAEGLLDVEWRLSLLRTGPTQEREHWSQCENRFRLKRRLARYEQRVAEMGGEYCNDPALPALLADIDGMRERMHRLEWDEYDARMREWKANAPPHELLPPAKRKPLRRHERLARVGKCSGPPVGWAAPGSTKPRRPKWLKAQDDHDAREAKCFIHPKPVDMVDWHEKELRRQEQAAAKRAARRVNRSANAIEHQCLALLEYAHGDGRVHRLGLDLGDGWMWYPTSEIPYATQRVAALQRCAVPVDDGWCFPPMGRSEEP